MASCLYPLLYSVVFLEQNLATRNSDVLLPRVVDGGFVDESIW